jgi:hypothetical protein
MMHVTEREKTQDKQMGKHLTSNSKQTVREKEKHSSIRTFAISSEDMSNVVEIRREELSFS